MLKLTRYKNEKLLINKGQIEIKVLSIRKETVALEIKAPTEADIDGKTIFAKFRTWVVIKGKREQFFFNRGQIEVKVLYIGNKLVIFGIKAPPEIDIDRLEIFIKKQAQAAANEPDFTQSTQLA